MNAYEIITAEIIEKMKQGEIPWKKPWDTIKGDNQNFITRHKYTGINRLMLWLSGGSTPYWLTYKQAEENGTPVKKGSKGHKVVFFKQWERENAKGEKESIPVMRYYVVFNADQCEGVKLPEPQERHKWDPIERAESIVSGMPNRPEISWEGGRACYSPVTDKVKLPERALFRNAHGYYETAFHELGHSTGHRSRLGRHKNETADCHFGSANYAREELVAEITSAFLCAESGIEHQTIENQAAYVQNWLKVLKDDSRLVVVAAGQAQKAADYILGKGVK